MARGGQAGPDWGKLKKGKAIAKGPGDPGWQYQLKHFELAGEGQVKQFDQPEAVELLGLAPGQISGRRSVSGAGTGDDSEGGDGRRLSTAASKGQGKDRKPSRVGLVTFIKPLTDITVFEHKNAAFEGHISEDEAQVTWLVNDQPVPTHRAQIVVIKKVRRLILKDCLLNENENKVTCVLDEATRSEGRLFVKEAPFEFTEPLKNHKVRRGEQCELQCTVNKLKITLQWLKDGQPITDIKEQVDGFVHKLILPKVDAKDKGVYTARFDNVQTEANVEVLGKSTEKKVSNIDDKFL